MTEPSAAATASRCDVCLSDFETADPNQRRCSDPCRDFVRRHKHASPNDLPAMWEAVQRRGERDREQEAAERERDKPCPSGKIRYPAKPEADKALGRASRWYRAVPGWLRAYQCERCDSWHLTSKPARVAAGTGGNR